MYKKCISHIVLIVGIAIVLCCSSLLLSMHHNNKIVGYVEGGKIYYNNCIYMESYETFEFEVGRCIGTVEWIDENTRSKIYKVKNKPDYIYLSMMLDHRIYKISE